MKTKTLRPQNLEFKTSLEEDEFNLDGIPILDIKDLEEEINEIFNSMKDSKIKSGRPNMRERSKNRGTKYISEEMDKFKNNK